MKCSHRIINSSTSHIIIILRSLQWLPINYHTLQEVCCITHSILSLDDYIMNIF